MFLHNHPDFKALIEITAQEQGIDDPSLVEKDYWIMHCLYGLNSIGLSIELKGGTSLSKGFGIIQRFSEDLDIKIIPDEKILGFPVFIGKNQDKPIHRNSRKNYFDWLKSHLEGKNDGILEVKRDEIYDDIPKYRNGGIRLIYRSIFELPQGLKEGILLEVGFDKTAPNEKKDISSWAFEKGFSILGSKLTDNRAFGVLCYKPKYTFVEKLQAIVRKYRLYKERKHGEEFPENFLRHYYDIFCLLGIPEVQEFIGTREYEAFKLERFQADDTKIKNCQGFILNNSDERKKFETEYIKTKALYYRGQIPFDEILARFSEYLEIL